MSSTDQQNNRPDPDKLLAEIKEDQARAARGKLKIFFGACPGVGKTYAMLQALRQRRDEGVAVLIGVVETHGRRETAALLDGLPRLPLKPVEYRGKTLFEFDVDAALDAKPALIAVDELAHTNVPGSRHAKRWQDIEELLAAGIDVYTTLNVQHLESLNDVVGQITGIKVRETVPDRLFDAADEVVVVDLPADELLQRLAAGKVYLPERAGEAAHSFFRKGNLTALRELALRRAADRVDEEVRAYRRRHAIEAVWPTRERLLVAVGSADDEPLIREAARLGTKLEADWVAVHVDRPAEGRSKTEREPVLHALSLAVQLGGEAVTLPGKDVAEVLLDYARKRNVTRLLIGGSQQHRAWLWRRRLFERLIAQAHGMTMVVLPTAPATSRKPPREGPHPPASRPVVYLWTALACGLTSLVATPLARVFDLSNIVMLFLLTVVLVALRFGRRAGALAALLAVLCFDYFFVPPRWSFAISDTQYLFTFVLMLAVALIIGQLTARLRQEAMIAREGERRAETLARLARELSAALTVERIVEITLDTFQGLLEARVGLALPDANGRVSAVQASTAAVDTGIAQWVFDHAQAAGAGTGTLEGTPARYLPLRAPMRVRGVLVLEPAQPQRLREPEELRLVEACAGQIAIALERVHYVEVVQDTLLAIEGERMRNTLLAVLSHDLRTPLTTIVGAADVAARQLEGHAAAGLVTQIREQAAAMQRLVENLLHLSRLQAGGATLDKQWHSLEEIVGSAVRQLEAPLARRRLCVQVPSDLPLIELDALLIERALVNLLDNAAKHTPEGSWIDLTVRSTSDAVQIMVADDGPGLPDVPIETLFEPFRRGRRESAITGIGLGLALARRIVEAHGGRLTAQRRQPRGSLFVISLPRRSPPSDAKP